MSQGAKTTENTAVNRLIELAGTKPLEVDEDLFLDATARAAREAAKRAVATAPQQPAPPKVGKAPSTGKTLPPPFRQSGPITAVVATLPPPRGGFPAATPPPELREPSTEPFELDEAEMIHTPSPAPAPQPPRLVALPGSTYADESEWFQQSQAVETYDEEYLLGTQGVPKQRGNATVWYVAGAFGLGLALAALFFWPGDANTSKRAAKTAGVVPAAKDDTKLAAPTPTVTPMPTVTAAPIVEPVPTIEPAPAPVGEVVPLPEPAPAPVVEAAPISTAVTFESSPAGANVMLVENGQMVPLGAAPVEHVLEPGVRYEVMFTLEGHASLMVPIAGGAAERVAATMGASTSTATVVKPAAAAPAVAEQEVEEAEPAPVITKPAPKATAKKKVAKAEPPPKTKKAAASSGGSGTLKIGAKPPCDVLIDGKKVGTSPIANLKVAAGKHTVTLINREYKIKETVSVTVKAGETVKVVKDLTKKMKK